MPKGPKVPNEALLAAGLDLMRQNGKPLRKLESSGRSMMYALPNGETVRARTCNDHILVILADQPTENAALNIEGTDFLLIVMPEIERTPGNVLAYLVPTLVAAEAARKTHREWLRTSPNTKGDNRTWNLWFDPGGKASGFAVKWSSYRLAGQASTESSGATAASSSLSSGNLKEEVEAARLRIAAAAGVSPSAVRITVDFGT